MLLRVCAQDNGSIPVTEVEEAAAVILKTQVWPAAQTVISNTKLLGYRGLSSFSPEKIMEVEGEKKELECQLF